MTISFSVTNDLSALSGGNQPLSKIDTNFSDIVSALSGVVMSQAEIVALIASSGAMPRSYLAGLTLTNNVSDATNDIDIAVGACRDSTNTVDMVLAAALTKRLDATWTVGSNQGWRDTGTIINGSYHTYVIKRSDTGTVDLLASLNNDNTGTITVTIASPGVVTWANHGLQIGSSLIFSTTGALPTGITAGTRYWVITAGFTTTTFRIAASEGGTAIDTSGSQSGVHTGTASPVMPTSYDYRRRNHSIIRAGAALVLVLNSTDDRDYMQLMVPRAEWDESIAGTTAVSKTLAFVPVGINAKWHGAVSGLVTATTGAANAILISDLATTDTAPTTAPNTGIGQAFGDVQTAVRSYGGVVTVRTNTSAQVRARAADVTNGPTWKGVGFGWWDRCGRDA